MFKKHPNSLKTSSPLKSSERRKMKIAVAAQFSLDESVADDLVPNPTFAIPFKSHLDEPGVIYLENGEPRWFKIDPSPELIPTLYTLHKHPNLLPAVWTGSGVIPALLNGADLMIPGVVHHPTNIAEGQLISICRFSRDRDSGEARLSVPVAVGRAALHYAALGTQEKGKAVHVLHAWKDSLWSMGSAPDGDLPSEKLNSQQSTGDNREEDNTTDDPSVAQEGSSTDPPPCRKPSPEETTHLLRLSLLHAIASRFGGEAPDHSFPIPASTFLSNHVMPCRPAKPSDVLRSTEHDSSSPLDPSDINIKNSTFKSLIAFLKSAEKDNLLTLKQPQKRSNQSETLVTSVNANHQLVLQAPSFTTVRDLEAKAAKIAQGKEKEREAGQTNGVEVMELYKAHGSSLPFFENAGSVSTLYTESQVKQVLNQYIASEKLVDPAQQQFILIDELLSPFIPEKQKKERSQFKREELLTALLSKMQPWHEVHAPGKDVVVKKGKISPIELAIKTRQSKKAVTTITGFEPFLVLSPDVMADDLRKLCAGSTSIVDLPGKSANSGVEVSVQGKHTTTVANYLFSKGIPRKWIHDSAAKTSNKKK